ncbi:MAG: hypothetical protein COA50_16060 [Flavobacteriaceae bacterium]|nr:MAG: hypothetical protein COA50_16060 [Flavobacteriaceae bacterium]
MNLKTERRIKFWISTIAKLLIIALIIFKLIPFLVDEKSNDEVNPNSIQKPIQKDTFEVHIKKAEKKEIVAKTKGIDSKEIHAPIRIKQILQYKGKILQKAYFNIAECNSCTSSKTGSDGVTYADIPFSLLNDDREFDFFVYRADTLLYHRSMRFSNLEFNKY